jgi:hypothetical protein
LGKVQTGTISTVVVVPIHMKDFLSVYGEEAGKDAFSETGSLGNELCHRDWKVVLAYQNQYL